MSVFKRENHTKELTQKKDLELLALEKHKTIALAGTPNVGKSSLFNALTGLKQHTGNWTGKTVMKAEGVCNYNRGNFKIIDLPGTYSLTSDSVEEEIARNYICFENPDVTIIVADATSLQKNLSFVLQILEITNKAIMCVNLYDLAEKKKIHIDLNKLSDILGIPVVATSATTNKGINGLIDTVDELISEKTTLSPIEINYSDEIEIALEHLVPLIDEIFEKKINSRFIGLKLLLNDESILRAVEEYFKINLLDNNMLQNRLVGIRLFLKEFDISENLLKEQIITYTINEAELIYNQTVTCEDEYHDKTGRKIDKILTSKMFGVPIMIGFLALIFYLTIVGANYPSALIADILFFIEGKLSNVFVYLDAPDWLHGVFVFGIYRTLAWVIAVMLPPMAIFFPIFTFLEELGYLPRIAFNLDNFFKKACAHGKQALTMCMGFGCNAAGVIGCRIINSPREKLIAIITNNFVPCNGRFPTMIIITSIFFVGVTASFKNSIFSAIIITSIIGLGVVTTLIISKILSLTLLKGVPSSFTLELPPYRKPKISSVLVRSLVDKTLFVLIRAIKVAAPSGVVIWIMANVTIFDVTIIYYVASALDPLAWLIGLDGYILLAFILGFPANEIVLPIIIMSYMATGNILELDNLSSLRELLIQNGWTSITAICTILFSLMHFPCGTTCLTIRKETNSLKWTIISFVIPTIVGVVVCFIVANLMRLLGA